MEQAFAAKTGDLLIKNFSGFMFFEKFRQDFVRKKYRTRHSVGNLSRKFWYQKLKYCEFFSSDPLKACGTYQRKHLESNFCHV